MIIDAPISKRALFFAIAFAQFASVATGAQPLILDSGYPRAGYFRTSEWTAANSKSGFTYAKWEAEHALLGGIYGKVLGEESVGTEEKDKEGLTKLDYFNRYKNRFPDKLVLLHFNGNARMPVCRPGALFAGHWLYYAPARVLSAIPATSDATTIRVASVAPLSLTEGRYGQNGTDICLVRIRNGSVDWTHIEQATVTAIDKAAGAITIRRGQYGTVPLDFRAGAAFAFPHASEGPFGPKGQKPPLLWKYNYSLDAPRDARGRILADTLSDEIAGLFAADGKLRLFDGLEFDAMSDHPKPEGTAARKKIDFDFNADGAAEDGLRYGLSRYGLGARRFLEELRRKMGPGKIIMADIGQRGFGILNGVESEGFPRSQWFDFVLWSERMNKMDYWTRHSASPAFSLIAGKFEAEEGMNPKDPAGFVPLSAIRLQIAASALCGAAYFPFYKPNPESKNLTIWDELVMGQTRRTGWLGMPVADTVYLSERLPSAIGAGWPKKLSSESATIKPQGKGAVIAGKGTGDIAFTLSGTPYKNNAIFVTMTVRAAPRKGAPAEYARLMTVACGQKVKTWRKQELALDAYVGAEPFTARFYFSKNRYEIKSPGDPCDLLFTVEGPEPVYVESIEIRNEPDVAYREFQNGLVLANPSDRSFTFDLQSLFPDKSFTRLTATDGQDQSVNNGKPAGKMVTVPGRDALFLSLGSTPKTGK